MCGIAGIYLRDPSFEVDMDEITSTLLAEIEERGQHATGVVAIGDEGEIEWQKASCDATTFNRYRRIIPNSARVVLGHVGNPDVDPAPLMYERVDCTNRTSLQVTR